MVKLNTTAKVERQRAFRLDDSAKYNGVQARYSKQMSLSDTRLKMWRDTPQEIYFRSPVRIRSAVCAFLFMSAITRLDMDMDNLKSRDLTEFLNDRYPQIIWEPYSVGKLLGELYTVTQAFLLQDRIDWPEHLPVPIQRIKKPAGISYALAPSGEGMAWFHALHFELYGEAVKERDDPKYSAGQGVWGNAKGLGQTAMFLAAERVRNRLVELNLGVKGLFSVHPDTWVTDYANTRSI